MKEHISLRMVAALLVGTTGLAVACGGGEPKQEVAAPAKQEASAVKEGTGKVIIVEAFSDEKGNYFQPAKIEAHQGDIVRFTLKSGVHNVNFLADSNAGRSGLPAASEMLQLPGQTYDVKVTFAKGHYYFQCDPHALLGMKGHLEVEN